VARVVPPDRVWSDVLPSGLAWLVLHVDAATLRELPLPTTDDSALASAEGREEWRLRLQPMVRVVGPGGLEFVVGAIAGTSDAATAWNKAAQTHGGAIVQFMRVPDHTTSGERVRGGFIRLVEAE
jgi:hypothetical protein